MWYLLLTLYLPLQDKELYVRFDDFRSKAPCIQAKIKLMEHQADLMKKSQKESFIIKRKINYIYSKLQLIKKEFFIN